MEPHLKWPNDNSYPCIAWTGKGAEVLSLHSKRTTEENSAIVLCIVCDDVESINQYARRDHLLFYCVMGCCVHTAAVDIPRPKNLAQPLTILDCILEVSDSNRGRYTDYSRDFLKFSHAEACLLPQLKLRHFILRAF